MAGGGTSGGVGGVGGGVGGGWMLGHVRTMSSPALTRICTLNRSSGLRRHNRSQRIEGIFGFGDFMKPRLKVGDFHGLPARQGIGNAIDGNDKRRLGLVGDARMIPDPPVVEGDPVDALANADVRVGHRLLEVLLVLCQAFRAVGIADVGDFLVRHGLLRAIDDRWQRAAGRAGLDFVHAVGHAIGPHPDHPVLVIAALVLAVAFVACDSLRVRDPVPLPQSAVYVEYVAGALPVDIHVVAADAPQTAIDRLGDRDLAGFGVRFGIRLGCRVRVVAVVEVRPLARHGDGEAQIAVGEGRRAVHAVNVVVARAGDENGVPVLEAVVMRTRIALDNRELGAGEFVAGPDNDVRRCFLEDD